MESPGKTRHARGEGRRLGRLPLPGVIAGLVLLAATPPSWAVPLDEVFLRVEINATDGDAGFHGKLDAEAWKSMTITTPGGREIFELEVRGALRRQGLTENFFESEEPTCVDQPLAAFLRRFPPGVYKFKGETTDGRTLRGEATLSHALPAAPDISGFDGSAFVLPAPVVITWGPGTDLGGCHDQTLVDDGTIPDPAGVPVDSWEVAVEPDEAEREALGLPLRVFTVQLPAGQQSVTVPAEYLQAYVSAGITTFKFEVGAKAGENQTFSEGSFTVTNP